jgi:hypothetical protein
MRYTVEVFEKAGAGLAEVRRVARTIAPSAPDAARIVVARGYSGGIFSGWGSVENGRTAYGSIYGAADRIGSRAVVVQRAAVRVSPGWSS